VIHTYAWLAWLVAVLVSLSTTRNPFYLILILLCIAIIHLQIARSSERSREPVSPLRFSLIVISLTTLFNALTSHFGETVLFTIPGNLPLLSGNVTLEAIVYGATNGLVLSSFFAGFLVLNNALPVRSLLRLVPRAFYPVAVVISVAVTYIPATQRQFTQIREAQAIRGHQPRGLRGWLPLLMPLLVGGLERAMTLAEAMTARGFASTPQESSSDYQRAFILLGVLLLPAGWIISLLSSNLVVFAAVVSLAGAGLLFFGLWSAGKQSPHTTYRQEAWKGEDWVILMGALLVLGAYLLSNGASAGLNYSAYPKLTLPTFDPLLGIATLGLLAPSTSHSR
jgi:energy-coupling factor transport system permease protein